MNIREEIGKRSKLSAVIALVCILLATFYLTRHSFSRPTVSTTRYFTTDNGKTTIILSTDQFAPFMQNGQTANMIIMYSCDGGKTVFPGYLQRYTPAAKARLESELADLKSGKTANPLNFGPADSEIKKCDDASPWVSNSNFAAATKIKDIHCPDGNAVVPVDPQ
jgi:hypothetical protein